MPFIVYRFWRMSTSALASTPDHGRHGGVTSPPRLGVATPRTPREPSHAGSRRVTRSGATGPAGTDHDRRPPPSPASVGTAGGGGERTADGWLVPMSCTPAAGHGLLAVSRCAENRPIYTKSWTAHRRWRRRRPDRPRRGTTPHASSMPHVVCVRAAPPVAPRGWGGGRDGGGVDARRRGCGRLRTAGEIPCRPTGTPHAPTPHRRAGPPYTAPVSTPFHPGRASPATTGRSGRAKRLRRGPASAVSRRPPPARPGTGRSPGRRGCLARTTAPRPRASRRSAPRAC